MKRLLFAVSIIWLFVLGAGVIGAPLAHAVIDSKAKSEFKQSVSETGGPSSDNLLSKIKAAINLLLYLAGTIAVIVIVIGGIRFVTSDGDPGKADKARNAVVYAAIGLAIALTAYAIVNFVLERFG